LLQARPVSNRYEFQTLCPIDHLFIVVIT